MNLYAVVMKVGGTIRPIWVRAADEVDAVSRAQAEMNWYGAVIKVNYIRRVA